VCLLLRMRFGRCGELQRIACEHGDSIEEAYQKWTVLGPMGLFQNLAKPAGSAPAAVLTLRRAFARWKKGRKVLKMREPGRNDMMASCVLYSRRRRFEEKRNWGVGSEVEAGAIVVCEGGRDVGLWH
jgi:hypothetical protein